MSLVCSAPRTSARISATLLTPEALLQFLRETGRITDRAIVDGELAISDISRRNQNYRVIQKDGTSLVIKHDADADGMPTLEREAAVYKQLNAAADRSVAPMLAPRMIFSDHARSILGLEFIHGARTLREHHSRVGKFSERIASETGRMLAAVHQLTPEFPTTAALERPWVSELHRPNLAVLQAVSVANMQLIKILQRYPEYCQLLDAIADEWMSESLIHMDVKFENWLITQRKGDDRWRHVLLIDWELAGRGDPRWDVGSMFAEYLSTWVNSMPLTGDSTASELAQHARFPLSRMQLAIRSFWASYISFMSVARDQQAEFQMGATRFAALRLLQTAFEQAQHSAQISGSSVYHLQLSRNILARPQEASIQLLGLIPQGSW
ncbi:phosphotransferase family protein [Nakamurella sp. GG22]